MSIDVYAEKDGNLFTVLDGVGYDDAPFNEFSEELFEGLVGYVISREDRGDEWTLTIHNFPLNEEDYLLEEIEDPEVWQDLNKDIIKVLLDVVGFGGGGDAPDYNVHTLGTEDGSRYYEIWLAYETALREPILRGALSDTMG